MFATRSLWVVLLLSLSCWAQGGNPADEEAKKKIEEFKQAYKTNDEGARTTAVSTLGQCAAPGASKLLASVLAADPSPAVRKAAAEGLGRPADDIAIQGLSASVDGNKHSPEVLKAIVESLVQCDSERGLDALHGLFNFWSFYDVAQEAVNGAGKIASPNSIPPLLTLLRKAEQERDVQTNTPQSSATFNPSKDPNLIKLIEPCMAALKQCAGGADGGTSFKQWDAWWKNNQGTLKYAQVFWCPGTKKTFEVKPGEKKLCPFDGDQVKGCGVPLKRKVLGKE